MNLYVTGWSPNGTNDLLICDEDSQIIVVIEQATFGIDVMKGQYGESLLVCDSESVFSAKSDGFEESESIGIVRQIDLGLLYEALCVSPIDPDGARLIAELRKHGIELNN